MKGRESEGSMLVVYVDPGGIQVPDGTPITRDCETDA